jgi:hypothetical protein
MVEGLSVKTIARYVDMELVISRVQIFFFSFETTENGWLHISTWENYKIYLEKSE